MKKEFLAIIFVLVFAVGAWFSMDEQTSLSPSNCEEVGDRIIVASGSGWARDSTDEGPCEENPFGIDEATTNLEAREKALENCQEALRDYASPDPSQYNCYYGCYPVLMGSPTCVITFEDGGTYDTSSETCIYTARAQADAFFSFLCKAPSNDHVGLRRKIIPQ